MSYNAILQESTLFELFESSAYSDTLKALVLAQQEITAKILSIADDTWTRKRLQSVRKLIDEEILKAYSGTLPTLQGELPAIAGITAKNMLGTSFTKVPTSVIDQITSDTFEVQGYQAKELFDTLSDNHARQLRVLVGAGVAQGKTANTIVNELVQKNSQLSRGQLKNAIFTTITEARASTRHNSFSQLEQNGVIKGYEYVATLDGRTTEYCRNHDGRRYHQPISEIQGEINVHFHCRSVFVPFTKSTAKDTRASTFGQVPDEPYGKWFSKQSDNFQRATLGAKKYKAYKAGDYKIGGLADVTGQVLKLEAIASVLEAERSVPEIDFGYDGQFNGYVADIRDEAKIVIDTLEKPRSITLSNKGSYTYTTQELVSKTNKHTFLHEYGHHIDGMLSEISNRDAFLNAISKDSEIYSKTSPIGRKNIDSFIETIKGLYLEDRGRYSGISSQQADIIDAMTNGYMFDNKGVGGHGKVYYKRIGAKGREVFANMFALYSHGDNWEYTTQLFPNISKEFESIMSEVKSGKFN